MAEILINTNATRDYPSGHGINVTVENPWDPLSKVFKKYGHTIQYSPSNRYVPAEYSNSV